MAHIYRYLLTFVIGPNGTPALCDPEIDAIRPPASAFPALAAF